MSTARAHALQIAKKMTGSSLAYRKFVKSMTGREAEDFIESGQFERLPLMTKLNFFKAYPWKEILPKELYDDVYSLIRSSGTTQKDKSKGFFWPQLKSEAHATSPGAANLVRHTFKLESRRTLVVVGMSLGSWAGGEQFSIFFKNLSLNSSLPLVVFSPGNQHGEILESIDRFGSEFDQIIVVLCPSAIFYLERLALEMKIKLPFEKISYLITGEPFAEDFRMEFQNSHGRSAQSLPLFSIYGSADTGSIGIESGPLIQLRQWLSRNPNAASRLKLLSTSIPNLYHEVNPEVYLESINDELVVTKWQGLPLIRYNLKDRVQFFSWKELCDVVLSCLNPSDVEHARWAEYAKLDLARVMAIYGRSEGCLFLCGSNIFDSMLQEVLLRSSLRDRSTGAFVAWVEHQMGQQVLHWQLELKAGVSPPSSEEQEALFKEFVERLSEQQPEFGEDYEKFYRSSEDSGLRIFQFHFCGYPKLSENEFYTRGIKRPIIIEKGPL